MVLGVDFVEQRESVAVGQAHVADHQARRVDLQPRACLLGTIRFRDFVAGGRQAHRQQAQHAGIVVHQEYALVHG